MITKKFGIDVSDIRLNSLPKNDVEFKSLITSIELWQQNVKKYGWLKKHRRVA